MAQTLSGRVSNVVRYSSYEGLSYLKHYVQSGEFRDEEFNMETYTEVFNLLRHLMTARFTSKEDIEFVHNLRSLFLVIVSCEEFDGLKAGEGLSDSLAELLVSRANPSRLVESDADNECSFIESCLRLLYGKLVSRRGVIRREIGRFLHEYVQIPTRTSHLTPILNFLNDILYGMAEVDRSLFTEILLPLHKPNGWSYWDRQTPILGEYHKSLVQCCYTMITKDPSLATILVDYILANGFAPVNQSNTAKELLLLFEISKFLDLVDLDKVLPRLMVRILDSINSENAQVVQSVLVFWKSPPSHFPEKLSKYLPLYMDSLVLALYRGNGEPHWNPTVNKMTLLVLKCLKSSNEQLFMDSCNRVIPETRFTPETTKIRPVSPSLIAPEIVSKQPPLGITGVAPWTNEPLPMAISQTEQILRGFSAMDHFMNTLEPSVAGSGRIGEKPWQDALSGETPTLLPDLKFHNLVFGKDLGIGSFSTVRYARVVKPKKYLSQWDEVAVKIINYETIKAHNYGENILREICCLRKLSHPSVARLVSSFRWRDGIYLVLEYGSCGDLHTYIRRNGPLNEQTSKVVVGEITTALAAVHETGFVYGDLKPENVVVTATRHVKLADFGACRPFTEEAKRLLLESRNELSNMRSGDWKPTESQSSIPAFELTDEPILSPQTFEGTTAYLPPEIASNPGQGPTVLGDAYALGMTTYFILKGRLPQWVELDNSNSSSKLFDTLSLIQSDSLFTDGTSRELREFILSLLNPDVCSRWTVDQVLTSDWFSDIQPVRRLYQKALGVDHLPGAEEGGSATSAGEDGAWEKRQLSKIWTAQPVDYALVSSSNVRSGEGSLVIIETEIERGVKFI
jgi:serine/threonine protein kinase